MNNDRWKFAWAWFVGAVLILLASLASAGDVKDQICPDGSCTILFDSQTRSIFGFGVRPTPNQNLGISTGMPFYDASTAGWYWYTGTAWSSTFGGGTFTTPLLLPNGSVSAPSLAFASYPSTGMFINTSGPQISFSVVGVNFLRIGAGGVNFDSDPKPNGPDIRILGSSSFSWMGLYLNRWIQGSKPKTLTDAAGAVSFVRIAVPTGGSISGDVIYAATSTDGTAALTRQARWSFAGADTAGTVTCGVGSEYGVATAYSRANTLVCTMTAVTATTNCDLQITCTDNLAAAQTMSFNWRLDMPLSATVTPQ